MNRLVQKNSGVLPRAKLRTMLDRARSVLLGIGDIPEVLGEVLRTIAEFHEKLRSPSSDIFQLSPTDRRDLEGYIGFLESVKTDLEVLYAQARESTGLLTDQFNQVLSVTDALTIRVNRMASLAQDLALLGNTPDSNIFVAGDSFDDASRIDKTTSLEVAGGGLTLARTGNVSVAGPARTKVTVEVGGGFKYDPTSPQSPDKQYRVYEGRYFAPVGRMKPAGGTLRWTTRNLDKNGEEVRPGVYEVEPGKGASEFQTVTVQEPPSQVELEVARAAMFDGNPTTSWEIEATYDPGGGEELLDRMADAPLLDRAEMLNAFVASVEDRDLDVTLTIDLGDQFLVNWINLVPDYVGEGSWLEILALETSVEPTDGWNSIEGLRENKYENVLTPDANATLTDEEVQATLAPDRYRYSGQGLWPFAPREVRFLRLVLRQKTPVLIPYQVIRYKLTRDVSTTTTQTRQVGVFG